MRKITILSFFLFFIINNFMAQEIIRQSHHLDDGTFTIPTGFSNNNSYKEIYNWVPFKNSINPAPFALKFLYQNFTIIILPNKSKNVN